MANISLKFVSKQGFDSGHCSATHPGSSLVLLFSIVQTVFTNPVLGRCVWEGAPPSLVTFSCSLCCLGHREQGGVESQRRCQSKRRLRKITRRGRSQPHGRNDSEYRADCRRPGSQHPCTGDRCRSLYVSGSPVLLRISLGWGGSVQVWKT